MTPSDRGIAFIKSFEAYRSTSYMPTPNDKPTIGFGSTGPDITMGMTWTRPQAEARFASDLVKFGEGVSSHLTSATSQCQFDALVSLAYNIGLGNFEGSTVLRMHNVGDYKLAAAHFKDWNRQDGEVLQGLTRRRLAEADMYLGH